MKLAVIGGGAAGFFLAINAKEQCPELEVTIFEQHNKVLSKLKVSGGGRCNCTNTFTQITDLKQVYPRGARLLKRLFKQFGPQDAYTWFEAHGVPLMTQSDQRVFPKAQTSHAIINCFTQTAQQLGVRVVLGQRINHPEALLHCNGGAFDFVAVTIGGTPHKEGCVPSLFTFNVADATLRKLAGTSTSQALLSIPGTKFVADGALLVTHTGLSGPSTLKLSSYAARHLADCSYQTPLRINWVGEKNVELVREQLMHIFNQNTCKQLHNVAPFGLSAKLWTYLLKRAQISTQQSSTHTKNDRFPSPNLAEKRCNELSKKDVNRLINTLTADMYHISGRSAYKEEFVTCGGIALDTIHNATLESKETPGLYYAGEVLDIDGITGGFNFTAAWSTAYAVAVAISANLTKE